MGDFPYVQWLARLYKKNAESSGLWTDYLKVCLYQVKEAMTRFGALRKLKTNSESVYFQNVKVKKLPELDL